jgi:hypothetical protein
LKPSLRPFQTHEDALEEERLDGADMLAHVSAADTPTWHGNDQAGPSAADPGLSIQFGLHSLRATELRLGRARHSVPGHASVVPTAAHNLFPERYPAQLLVRPLRVNRRGEFRNPSVVE